MPLWSRPGCSPVIWGAFVRWGVAALGSCSLAVFPPAGRHYAASASPGELHGLLKDPCAVEHEVAVALRGRGVGDRFGVARQGRRVGPPADRCIVGVSGVHGAGRPYLRSDAVSLPSDSTQRKVHTEEAALGVAASPCQMG